MMTMRTLAALSLLSSAALLAPSALQAQISITTNVSATTVTADAGPWAVSNTFADIGTEQVGPLRLTFNLFANAVAPVVCVDFNNFYAGGANYSANLTLLSSTMADIGARTRQGQLLGGSAGLARYLQMAWLSDKFATESTTQWGGIQGAIWNLGSTGTPSASLNSSVQFWLNQLAAADLSTLNLADYVIVTDVNAVEGFGGSQEFLVRANVVPEPSTYAMLITGLAGLVVLARRRNRAA
jgi:PEP-CTERM motif